MESCPVRGTWIEIVLKWEVSGMDYVVPRTGHVD